MNGCIEMLENQWAIGAGKLWWCDVIKYNTVVWKDARFDVTPSYQQMLEDTIYEAVIRKASE